MSDFTEDSTAASSIRTDPISEDEIGRRVRDAYDRVPEIGKGWRWYDPPYNVLWWLASGWRRRVFPRIARERLNDGVNYLIPFNEHDRHKIWDPTDPHNDFGVDPDEHVVVPTLWLVELFPPSAIRALEKAMARNKWDRRRVFLHGRDANAEMLSRSRAGSGWTWWTVANITDLGSETYALDGSRERLPRHFRSITLKAAQVGGGLTAVVATFSLKNDQLRSLDDMWHKPHDPHIVKTGKRPLAENRQFAGFRVTQQAREELHRAARDWMRKKVPGFFASNATPQPLMDLLLFDKVDPLSRSGIHRSQDDALRAVGLTEYGYWHYTSKEIPKLLLSPSSETLAPSITPRRTWALWGNRSAVIAAATHLDHYGTTPERAVAYRYGDGVESFIVRLSIGDFLEVVEGRYAELRDRARSQHGRFSKGALRQLRSALLTLSLDLTSVYRDLREYWESHPKFEGEAEFQRTLSAVQRKWYRDNGRTPPKSQHVNANMRERQAKDFEALIAADVDYRDILSTVASLSSSEDGSQLGRSALRVALASLAVAVVALLLADLTDHSVFTTILAFFAIQR